VWCRVELVKPTLRRNVLPPSTGKKHLREENCFILKEKKHSSETSVLTRLIWSHIPEIGIPNNQGYQNHQIPHRPLKSSDTYIFSMITETINWIIAVKIMHSLCQQVTVNFQSWIKDNWALYLQKLDNILVFNFIRSEYGLLEFDGVYVVYKIHPFLCRNILVKLSELKCADLGLT
jgi:hypothetical protein